MTPQPEYRIALRPDDQGLDDVVVRGVSMFRMERMNDNEFWLCCYLEGTDERISWTLWAEDGSLTAATTETPAPSAELTYEPGSFIPPDAVVFAQDVQELAEAISAAAAPEEATPKDTQP